MAFITLGGCPIVAASFFVPLRDGGIVNIRRDCSNTSLTQEQERNGGERVRGDVKAKRRGVRR